MSCDIFLILVPSFIFVYISKEGTKRPEGGATKMNKYELALVVSANVEDEVRTATIEKVNELITRFGGTITDPGTSEKKKLAYDIQHMSEGFYSFIKFEADATAPAEIESRVRIMDNVLRFLIVKDGE